MHLHKCSPTLRSLSSSSSGSSSNDLLCLMHSSPSSCANPQTPCPCPSFLPTLCSPSLSSSGSSSDDLLCLMHGSPSSANLGAVPGSPSSADEEGQVPRSSALAAAAAAAAGPAAKRARFTPAADDLQGGVAAVLGREGQGEEEEEQGAQEQQQEEEEVGGGLLELALTALWDDAMSRGLFRYDLSGIETKPVPGRLRFIAQVWSFVWGFCVGYVGCMAGGTGPAFICMFAPAAAQRGLCHLKFDGLVLTRHDCHTCSHLPPSS